MNPKEYSNKANELPESTDGEKLMGRREVISKAGLYALSTATMMVLLKSQAKASTSGVGRPAQNTAPDVNWQRTTRS